ncbi:MAG: hypothetical protein NVS3B16_24660 [Vulcanimicrobiaceae bacterium]
MKNSPQTYNDNRLDEVSRELFMTAVKKLQDILDSPDLYVKASPERLHALAAIADAAACGFKADEEGSDYE